MNKWLNTVVDAYIANFGKNENPIVYDVGSRDGDDGAEIYKRIGGKKIGKNLVLIEANPIGAELCRTNYPDATTLELAITEGKGTIDFLQVDDPDIEAMGTSTLSFEHTETKKPGAKLNKITVLSDRLDSLISPKTMIDVMKIDIEQFSWQALRSMGDLIKNVLVYHIETETNVVKNVMHKDWHNNDEIKTVMQFNGFELVGTDNEWGPSIEDQVWVNRNL